MRWKYASIWWLWNRVSVIKKKILRPISLWASQKCWVFIVIESFPFPFSSLSHLPKIFRCRWQAMVWEGNRQCSRTKESLTVGEFTNLSRTLWCSFRGISTAPQGWYAPYVRPSKSISSISNHSWVTAIGKDHAWQPMTKLNIWCRREWTKPDQMK